MPRLFRLAAALAAILVLAGSAASAGPLKVVVSIAPQKYFAEMIGGERVSVTVMVPAGSSPHAYEPKPKQLSELASAALYIACGVDFEPAWLPKFAAVNPKMAMVDMTAGIERLPMLAHHHHDEGAREAEDHDHEEGAGDPHTWLSPAYARLMAMTIRDALVTADPAGAASYHAGYAAFARECDALDAKILDILAGLGDKRAFLVYHPAFGYFAATYGLTQMAIEVEGKEPSPREMAAIHEEAAEHGVTVIFIEPQFARAQAEAIAEAIGAKVAVIDPLAANWPANLVAIAEALKGALAR